MKRETKLLLGAAVLALFTDLILGTQTFMHDTPLGMEFVWTPGLTWLYATFFLLLVRFVLVRPPRAATGGVEEGGEQ